MGKQKSGSRYPIRRLTFALAAMQEVPSVPSTNVRNIPEATAELDLV